MYTIIGRRLVPILRDGGEGGGGAPADPPAPKPDPPKPDAPAALSLTQEELDRRLTAEKAQGKRAAAAELAEKLGCSVDEAVAKLKAMADADDAAMTEAERKERKAVEAMEEAGRRTAEAELRAHRLAIKEALADAGVAPARREYAVGALSGVEPGATDAEINQAVAKLKADLPEFFGEAAPNGAAPPEKPKPPASRPQGAAPRPAMPVSGYEAGFERGKTHAGDRDRYQFEQEPARPASVTL